ncbi:MAG: glycosyltransferase family 2 protein [Bacteroidetes bacterium]|nr:glycosyltransferase family 2 protein [Bacteroidota bacterium]
MVPELSIVVPVFNEEQVIPELYERLKKVAQKISAEHEIIFVNDGSRDGTLIKLKEVCLNDKRAYYISFSRNFGHQIAVCAGLDFCRGRKVAIIDGDLQDPPELIEEMYQKSRDGIEVVYARRRQRKGETWFKKVSAHTFYKIIRKMTKIDIPLDTGDFRVIDMKVVKALRQMPEQNKFLRGQIAWLGFKSEAVLFDRDERKYGKTGYPLSKMLKFAIDGLTAFSDKPLVLVTRLGLWVSFISLLVILYALYSHFVLERTITGWTSMIISSMFIGGIQLLSIGIIGEYISRINSDVRKRPLYVIGEDNLESVN